MCLFSLFCSIISEWNAILIWKYLSLLNSPRLKTILRYPEQICRTLRFPALLQSVFLAETNSFRLFLSTQILCSFFYWKIAKSEQKTCWNCGLKATYDKKPPKKTRTKLQKWHLSALNVSLVICVFQVRGEHYCVSSK